MRHLRALALARRAAYQGGVAMRLSIRLDIDIERAPRDPEPDWTPTGTDALVETTTEPGGEHDMQLRRIGFGTDDEGESR